MIKTTIKGLLGVLTLNLFLCADTSFETGIVLLGKETSAELSVRGKKKIAIFEFNDLNGNINDFGRYFTEELTTELSKIKEENYTIVDRLQLAKLLQKLKVSEREFLNPGTIRSINKILDVDSILTGSIIDLGENIRINVRIISVTSQKIIASKATTLKKDPSIQRLLSQNTKKAYIEPPTQPLEKTNQNTFKNNDLHISFTKLQKHGNEITMMVTYKNVKEEDITLSINEDLTKLIDENGEVWNNTKNTLLSGSSLMPTAIKSNKELMSKMTFSTHGVKNGTTFNFNAKYYSQQKDFKTTYYTQRHLFNVRFKDLKIP
jgi:TolB-like protein